MPAVGVPPAEGHTPIHHSHPRRSWFESCGPAVPPSDARSDARLAPQASADPGVPLPCPGTTRPSRASGDQRSPVRQATSQQTPPPPVRCVARAPSRRGRQMGSRSATDWQLQILAAAGCWVGSLPPGACRRWVGSLPPAACRRWASGAPGRWACPSCQACAPAHHDARSGQQTHGVPLGLTALQSGAGGLLRWTVPLPALCGCLSPQPAVLNRSWALSSPPCALATREPARRSVAPVALPVRDHRRSASCGEFSCHEAQGREMQGGPTMNMVGPPCEVLSGDVLLSHTVSRAVPSALRGLASGFGMLPGVSLSLWSPKLYGDISVVRPCGQGGTSIPDRISGTAQWTRVFISVSRKK